jgi:hypothetical protein
MRLSGLNIFGQNEAVGVFYPDNMQDYNRCCHSKIIIEVKNLARAAEAAKDFYDALFFNPMAVEIVRVRDSTYKLKAMSYVEKANCLKTGGIEDF